MKFSVVSKIKSNLLRFQFHNELEAPIATYPFKYVGNNGYISGLNHLDYIIRFYHF